MISQSRAVNSNPKQLTLPLDLTSPSTTTDPRHRRPCTRRQTNPSRHSHRGTVARIDLAIYTDEAAAVQIRWRRADGVAVGQHPGRQRRRSPAAGRTPCRKARRIGTGRGTAMPHGEPEFELLTIPQIAARRGVSRQHVHRTAQQDPAFPGPIVTPGSTRAKYRSDEINHYYDNRVLRPGRRTDMERP